MPWHHYKGLPPRPHLLILTWLGLQCYLQPRSRAGGDHAVRATSCPCKRRCEARLGVINDLLEWFVWFIVMEPLFSSFSENQVLWARFPPPHTPNSYVKALPCHVTVSGGGAFKGRIYMRS